jgi:cytochrome c oxidase subunit 2
MVWIIVAGLALILGGLVIATITPSIFPVQGSAESQQIDALFRFMLAVGGSIFLLVQGVLVYSIIKFRAKPGERGDGPPMHGNATLEIVWTVIPAIIVFIIVVYSVRVWDVTRSVKPNEQTVHSVGARYAWSFAYDIERDALPADIAFDTLDPAVQEDFNEDGQVTFTSSQLHTWVNQPVSVNMEAQDVNHAFWIPGMRVKQDVLVGRVTNVRFTPIEAGVYRIVCAELCGSGHGNMAGEVAADGSLVGAWMIVHPDEATFMREFFEPERNTVLFPPEDPVLRGRQILASGKYPCATCHILTDLGWAGAIGPSMDGLASRTQRLAASGHPDMASYIHASIRHPGEYLVPGYNNLMPQFNDDPSESNYMPEDELDAIVAYLLTQTGN